MIALSIVVFIALTIIAAFLSGEFYECGEGSASVFFCIASVIFAILIVASSVVLAIQEPEPDYKCHVCGEKYEEYTYCPNDGTLLTEEAKTNDDN